MLSVANKPIMLSVVILSVFMLSVILLSALASFGVYLIQFDFIFWVVGAHRGFRL